MLWFLLTMTLLNKASKDCWVLTAPLWALMHIYLDKCYGRGQCSCIFLILSFNLLLTAFWTSNYLLSLNYLHFKSYLPRQQKLQNINGDQTPTNKLFWLTLVGWSGLRMDGWQLKQHTEQPIGDRFPLGSTNRRQAPVQSNLHITQCKLKNADLWLGS